MGLLQRYPLSELKVMNKKCYRLIKIVGLRSNPGLLWTKKVGVHTLLQCGLKCDCYVILSDFDSKQAAEVAVIKMHDQFLERDKRNRIRESAAGSVSNGPEGIRRSPWGVDRIDYSHTPSVSLRASLGLVSEAQNIRPYPIT